MHAIRVARGYTRRDKIVKFEGQYHGVHDYALISVTPNDVDGMGDRANPVKLAWGRGIPEAIKDTVIPVPYNDLDTLRAVFEREGDQIAAVLIEPLLGNAQGILPRPGFLAGVREMTREFGALLIFDEVKTGFRLARGGAAELFGIEPDLACYAKAMGNGYPAAAFGGRREVMSVLPKDVSHGGTYAGNRVAAAAATRGAARDPGHGRAGAGPPDRAARPGRPRAGHRPARAAVRVHGRARDVRRDVHGHAAGRLPRLVQHRPPPVRRGRGRHAPPRCLPGARLPRALVHEPGARRARTSWIAWCPRSRSPSRRRSTSGSARSAGTASRRSDPYGTPAAACRLPPWMSKTPSPDSSPGSERLSSGIAIAASWSAWLLWRHFRPQVQHFILGALRAQNQALDGGDVPDEEVVKRANTLDTLLSRASCGPASCSAIVLIVAGWFGPLGRDRRPGPRGRRHHPRRARASCSTT